MSTKEVTFVVHCKPLRADHVFKRLFKMEGQNLFMSRIKDDLILVKLPENRLPEIAEIDGVDAVEKAKQYILS
jgi:hypothetical protein